MWCLGFPITWNVSQFNGIVVAPKRGASSRRALYSTTLVPASRSYDIRDPFSSHFVALLPLDPTSDKLCLDSICDPHMSQTSLATPSLPVIYPCLSILRHHTPRRISLGSLHFLFPKEIDTLEYSWLKAIVASMRLRIYL
jgi:hypothetical protein